MDIYKKLAKHLDDLPGGYPSTPSGVELRILKRLFTPQQAELALHLSVLPEEARVIALRAGIEVESARARLHEMAQAGLIMDQQVESKPAKYQAAHFVIGIWEFHVNSLDPELIRDVNEYIPYLFDHSWAKMPQLRTIPVSASIDATARVLPHEQAEKLLDQHDTFLVAPCICRREHRMSGQGCDKPEESCLLFGDAALFYHRNGLGRLIDREEMRELIRGADAAGLVLQPSNAKNISNICCCCGCCCQILKNLKRYPKPAELVSAPFTVRLDPSLCVACGVCEDRCQMDALSLGEDTAELDADRCIGCGLCVSTCPSDALSLVRKPASKQSKVPGSFTGCYVKLARKRGKMGAGDLASLVVRSTVDRLRAPRR